MKKENQKHKTKSHLYKKTVKKIKSETIDINKLSEAEVRKLALELQVYQIELDMQNDELRSTQKYIEKSQQKYKKLYDSAPVGYCTFDHNGLIVDANLTLATMLGIEQNILKNQALSQFITKKCQDIFYLYCKNIYKNKTNQICDLKMRRKNGTTFYAHLECAISQGSDGNSRKCKLIITDITKSKNLEEMLLYSNEKLELLFSSIPSIIIELTIDYNVSRWNSFAEKNFEIAQSDIIGKPFRECNIEWDWDTILNATLLCKETKNATWIDDFKYKKIDRKKGYFSIAINPIIDSTGKLSGILILMSDITERKDMEHQLLRSQKLESIGHLAAGIAHEINTPTQYIVDNTNFLKDAFSDINKLLEKYSQLYEKSKSGSITPELIAEIDVLAGNADIDYLVEEIPNAINQSLEGLDRVKKIVYAMKNFSHPDNEDKKFVDINESIKNTIDIARNEWKYIARVKTDFDSSLTSVPCFPGDFNQVILNLIVNAAHAIGGASDNGSEAKGTISISTRCDGEWAEIRVSDTGTGIPEHIRSMIFDPFFTTKEVGKGTGQGLPLVHSTVVGKHNGTITLDTELGKGTTFIIRLPLCSSSSEILTSETV